MAIYSPFPTLLTHQRHAFFIKKKNKTFNWFTKELQTTLKLTFVQKGKKKKKRPPKHPETKGRRHKIDTKEQEETERQEISIIHTQWVGVGREQDERAFKSISPHSSGDNLIRTNNQHNMKSLGLKRQQR